MLCSKITLQRLNVEFLTDKNLYDPAIVEPLMENFLHDLTATLGMTIIMGPLVKTVEDGTSAYVMFAESGAQIHSWFEHRFVALELSSCKPYVVSTVLDVIDYWFEPTKLEIN